MTAAAGFSWDDLLLALRFVNEAPTPHERALRAGGFMPRAPRPQPRPARRWHIGDRFIASPGRGRPPIHWRVLTEPAEALDGLCTTYVWAEPLVVPGITARVWPIADIPAQEAP